MATLKDRALAPDPYAQLRSYKERMKGAWLRVIWSGALLVVFVIGLANSFELGQKTDATTRFLVVTALGVARFGYCVWRLIQAYRDVEAAKQQLGL